MTAFPRSRPFTRDDLDAMPDDGHRYELFDGMLVVSPAPSRQHQRVVVRLVTLLAAVEPADELLIAPFNVVPKKDTVLQPDLLIARRSDLSARDLPAAPMLAVWQLQSGIYVEAGRAEGRQPLRVQRPVDVSIVPADLVS